MIPGNASQLSDGASACVLMEEQEAIRLGLEPLGAFVGYVFNCVGVIYIVVVVFDFNSNLWLLFDQICGRWLLARGDGSWTNCCCAKAFVSLQPHR
jgi:hypothetical protein